MMARSRSSTSNAQRALWPATWLSMLSTSDVHLSTSPRANERRESMFATMSTSAMVAPRARVAPAPRRVARAAPLVARGALAKRRVAPRFDAPAFALAIARGGRPRRGRGQAPLPKETFSNATKMRSEAQAPFRVARMFLFGAFGANATLGFGIAVLQAVTKALGAPNGPPLDQSLQNLGINLGCALFFGYLYKRDADGRDKQMARISREERLSNLKCELAGGKVVSLYDLRGFSRVVVAAGDAAYCAAAIEAANAVRDPLVERGVLLVPVVVEGDASSTTLPPILENDRRFRAAPVSVDKYRRWFDEQKNEAKVAKGRACTSVCAWTGACGRPAWACPRGRGSRRSCRPRTRGEASWTASTGASGWTRERARTFFCTVRRAENENGTRECNVPDDAGSRDSNCGRSKDSTLSPRFSSFAFRFSSFLHPENASQREAVSLTSASSHDAADATVSEPSVSGEETGSGLRDSRRTRRRRNRRSRRTTSFDAFAPAAAAPPPA